MNSGIHTVIYPVADLAGQGAVPVPAGNRALRRRALLRRLPAGRPAVRPRPQRPPPGNDRPCTYYHVDDLEDLLRRLRDSGASQQGEVRDVGGGKLVVTLTDPDGNVFGLSQEP